MVTVGHEGGEDGVVERIGHFYLTLPKNIITQLNKVIMQDKILTAFSYRKNLRRSHFLQRIEKFKSLRVCDNLA